MERCTTLEDLLNHGMIWNTPTRLHSRHNKSTSLRVCERVFKTHPLGEFKVGRFSVDKPCYQWEELTQVLKVGYDSMK
jgi:hypothetical protein